MSSPLHFSHHLPSPPISGKPCAYCAGLAPFPSALHSQCLTRECLCLWHPLMLWFNELMPLTDTDLEHILTVINVSWARGTCETYSAGLLVFHTFCNSCNIPNSQYCPAALLLIVMFISSCASSYSGATLTNYVFSIQVWHVLHGQPWSMDYAQVKATLNRVDWLQSSS